MLTIVYQCGIANVFRPSGQRVYQGDFRTAEAMLRGAQLCGASVKVYHCDVAGDVATVEDQWQPGPGEMFGESKRPPIGGRA
jgi:hypothetical protein